MKLLFDQNISYKVAKKIQSLFSGSNHLSDIGLMGAKDMEIWEYAKSNNYCIVTFDFDFIDISMLKGSPPKIILLKMGNTGTEKIISKIQEEYITINEFLNNDESDFLELK